MGQAWRKSSRSAANGNCLEVAALPWRKSSRSVGNGACLEVADWRKASRSAFNGDCLEAAAGRGVILVRDSKDKRPSAPVLKFSSDGWRRLLADIKSGRLG